MDGPLIEELSMSNFKIGDHVEGVNFTVTTKCNGMQGVIVNIGPYRAHDETLDILFKADYRVEWADGDVKWVLERNIRRLPDDELFTSWFNNTIITDIRPTETQVREGQT